jgi:hypothetical protein
MHGQVSKIVTRGSMDNRARRASPETDPRVVVASDTDPLASFPLSRNRPRAPPQSRYERERGSLVQAVGQHWSDC